LICQIACFIQWLIPGKEWCVSDYFNYTHLDVISRRLTIPVTKRSSFLNFTTVTAAFCAIHCALTLALGKTASKFGMCACHLGLRLHWNLSTECAKASKHPLSMMHCISGLISPLVSGSAGKPPNYAIISSIR